MNKDQLVTYLERIDAALQAEAILYIYGSAAFILLGEPGRTSLDVDVAGPYCRVDERAFRAAAARAGLAVDPQLDTEEDHIEWISSLRLCLPKPAPESDIMLWRGKRLSVKTVAIPALIASKLIRYDASDRSDVQYLLAQQAVAFNDVAAAVRSLPPPFDKDAVVLENLENYRNDLSIWTGSAP
ncbi:MAG: hypothetical protein HYV35_06075 [Lentisphaerae bacterium]|nr:hypothetical protein [Lentisphaerota bacterium]